MLQTHFNGFNRKENQVDLIFHPLHHQDVLRQEISQKSAALLSKIQ